MSTTKKSLLILVSATLILGAGGMMALATYYGSPVIEVSNQSEIFLETAKVNGSGFVQDLGSIPPGKSVSVEVHPMGESGLELSFTIDGKEHKSDDLAYIESHGGYCVTLIVKPDFSVEYDSARSGILCPRLQRLW